MQRALCSLGELAVNGGLVVLEALDHAGKHMLIHYVAVLGRRHVPCWHWACVHMRKKCSATSMVMQLAWVKTCPRGAPLCVLPVLVHYGCMHGGLNQVMIGPGDRELDIVIDKHPGRAIHHRQRYRHIVDAPCSKIPLRRSPGCRSSRIALKHPSGRGATAQRRNIMLLMLSQTGYCRKTQYGLDIKLIKM